MKNTRLLRSIAFVLSLVAMPLVGNAQLPEKIESFPISEVRLTASPFKHAEDMDICYLLGLDADRLLAPYLKGAGLTPKAENYPNWENTGLDGHIGGHYLSALSYMYAATGDLRIKERLDYTLGELKRCQDASGNGYLCGVPGGPEMWKEISEGKIQAGGFDLNKKWVPLYNIHKIYAGLRDAYLQADRLEAKEMLIKLTDWMARTVSTLTDEQIQDMLRSEHGGLNETFADVAAITGNKRYLKLAHQFSHQTILQPLLKHEDQLTGMHANTQIPKVIGFKRIADVEGNEAWNEAARYFWETVVKRRTITIGGNSVREHFHPDTDFASMMQDVQGPETCNTYNMLRLTKMLYQTSADASYVDYYEQGLYNHILSTQNPVQGGFVYFTPMRAGHYRVYSQPQTSFWCCVGSGLENHARYGEMIYAHQGTDLYVNLFIPSTLNWSRQGIQIEQQTAFPDEEATTLLITPRKKCTFTLRLRCPEWAKADELRLWVNAEAVPAIVKEGYVTLNRTWTKGDKVRMETPMHLRTLQMPDNSPYYSILYGPIVLAARMGTERLDGLFADDSRGGHVANGPQLPLQEMPVIVGTANEIVCNLKKVADKPLTFTLSSVSPSAYEGMKLEPFFRLHECRYMVYWNLASPDELQAQQAHLAQQEKEHAALNALTADLVICGEQQPESDHFIEMEQADTGTDENRHWRETRSWFSYRMKANGKKVNTLRIVCKPDGKRDARIRIDGQEIGTLVAGKAVQEFLMPEALPTADQWKIRIETATSTLTPRIYEVRLIACPLPNEI